MNWNIVPDNKQQKQVFLPKLGGLALIFSIMYTNEHESKYYLFYTLNECKKLEMQS